MNIMPNLVIIGAGGHGRVVADMARKNGNYSRIGFLDDAEAGSPDVWGRVSDFKVYTDTSDFIVAIGDDHVRETILRTLTDGGAHIATLVHPQAVLGSDVTLGQGTVVMAGAVINPGARIGEGVIINTCSSVDHDSAVGDFCHISVGSHLAGTVSTGARVFVGAGAVVISNLHVCSDCVIGAGAAVIRDITVPGTYVGVPAKRLEALCGS